MLNTEQVKQSAIRPHGLSLPVLQNGCQFAPLVPRAQYPIAAGTLSFFERGQCPLWVKSRHWDISAEPGTRTLSSLANQSSSLAREEQNHN